MSPHRRAPGPQVRSHGHGRGSKAGPRETAQGERRSGSDLQRAACPASVAPPAATPSHPVAHHRRMSSPSAAAGAPQAREAALPSASIALTLSRKSPSQASCCGGAVRHEQRRRESAVCALLPAPLCDRTPASQLFGPTAEVRLRPARRRQQPEAAVGPGAPRSLLKGPVARQPRRPAARRGRPAHQHTHGPLHPPTRTSQVTPPGTSTATRPLSRQATRDCEGGDATSDAVGGGVLLRGATPATPAQFHEHAAARPRSAGAAARRFGGTKKRGNEEVPTPKGGRGPCGARVAPRAPSRRRMTH